MKQLRRFVLAVLLSSTVASATGAEQTQPVGPGVVDLKSADGTLLKATYFPLEGRGRASCSSTRPTAPVPPGTAWHANWQRLESTRSQSTGAVTAKAAADEKSYHQKLQTDMETSFQFLISQPGVHRDVIGLAGAGSYGVINALETARLHTASIKSLVMLSGDSFPPGIDFLHEASQLPELFVIADTDEYPPTVETMLWLYARASSPMRKLIHYSAGQEAPWLWYETSDPSKVPASGSHGTDLFKTHPDLPGVMVQWFVTTLIKTPGNAPVDPLAAATTLNQLTVPGGPAEVTQQLMEARKRNPKAQLFPEVSLDIIASGFSNQAETDRKAGHLREATRGRKTAIEIFKLNLLAYPDSADAHFNLADAYFTDRAERLGSPICPKSAGDD